MVAYLLVFYVVMRYQMKDFKFGAHGPVNHSKPLPMRAMSEIEMLRHSVWVLFAQTLNPIVADGRNIVGQQQPTTVKPLCAPEEEGELRS